MKSLVRFNKRAYCDETLSLDKPPRPSEGRSLGLRTSVARGGGGAGGGATAPQ